MTMTVNYAGVALLLAGIVVACNNDKPTATTGAGGASASVPEYPVPFHSTSAIIASHRYG